MNGVVFLREHQPNCWQVSADRLSWLGLVDGDTWDALEQARLTFHRQLVAVIGVPAFTPHQLGPG